MMHTSQFIGNSSSSNLLSDCYKLDGNCDVALNLGDLRILSCSSGRPYHQFAILFINVPDIQFLAVSSFLLILLAELFSHLDTILETNGSR